MGRKPKPKEAGEKQSDMITDGLLSDGFGEIVRFDGGQVVERPKHTAEQVLARRPETARAALDYLAGGMPIVRVARVLGLSPHTVRALRDNGLSLAQVKQRTGALMLGASEVAAEAVLEDLANPETAAKIPTQAKAIIAGIMAQRGADLVANGGSVAPVPQVVMSAGEYAAWLGSIGRGPGNPQQKGEPVECGAEVVEVPAARAPGISTGSDGVPFDLKS